MPSNYNTIVNDGLQLLHSSSPEKQLCIMVADELTWNEISFHILLDNFFLFGWSLLDDQQKNSRHEEYGVYQSKKRELDILGYGLEYGEEKATRKKLIIYISNNGIEKKTIAAQKRWILSILRKIIHKFDGRWYRYREQIHRIHKRFIRNISIEPE